MSLHFFLRLKEENINSFSSPFASLPLLLLVDRWTSQVNEWVESVCSSSPDWIQRKQKDCRLFWSVSLSSTLVQVRAYSSWFRWRCSRYWLSRDGRHKDSTGRANSQRSGLHFFPFAALPHYWVPTSSRKHRAPSMVKYSHRSLF